MLTHSHTYPHLTRAHTHVHSHTNIQHTHTNTQALEEHPQRSPFVDRTLLTSTLAGNAVDCLSITAPTVSAEAHKKKKGVVITGVCVCVVFVCLCVCATMQLCVFYGSWGNH